MSSTSAATSLPRSSPSEQGVDAAGILGFLDAVDAAPNVEMHSMMLLRHGAVIAEGWWSPYAAQSPHLLYSLSKSFTSTALGFAVAEGLVDLDDTVLAHFPELDAQITDSRSRRMKVRHVAAMASGHASETIDRALALDPEDLVRGFLLMPPDEEPGSVFAYNQPCTYSLAAILQRAAGMPLTDYLRPRLFDPLGIGEVGWLTDDGGRQWGFSGLHATTDAVAKLGQLYVQRGEWNGEQLLSAEWIDEATSAHVSNHMDGVPDWSQGYGFQFWMARHGYRGDGAYGQFCVVLPELDAVLTITGQSIDMQAVLDAAWEHLLPAFESVHGTESATQDAERSLAARLDAARLAPPGGDFLAQRAGTHAARTYAAGTGNEIASLTEITVRPAGPVTALTLRDAGDALHIDAGVGEWVLGDAIAASGGMTASGGADFEVIFTETPHRLRIECEGDSFSARWITRPLHELPLAQMRMPRTGSSATGE